MKNAIFLLLFALLLTACVSDKKAPSNNNPKASAYDVQLGLAYLQQGNRQRAKQKLLTAIAEDPHSQNANDALAYYYEKTQDTQQANYYYQQAIQFNPNSGAALNNYGTFLCRQMRYTEANQYFLKAIADPMYINTALAYENAGLCAVAAKDWKQAKDYFMHALAQDPSLKQSAKELSRIKKAQL